MNDYTIEIVHGTEHVVKNARVTPPAEIVSTTSESLNDGARKPTS